MSHLQSTIRKSSEYTSQHVLPQAAVVCVAGIVGAVRSPENVLTIAGSAVAHAAASLVAIWVLIFSYYYVRFLQYYPEQVVIVDKSGRPITAVSKSTRSVIHKVSATVLFGLLGWSVFRYAKPPIDYARIEIVGVEVARESESLEKYAFINIYYHNQGGLPTEWIGYRAAVRFYEREATVEEVEELANLVMDVNLENLDMEPGRHQMWPGASQKFFSIPNQPGRVADDFDRMLQDVLDKKRLLYVYVVFKYRDEAMKRNSLRITEECFYYVGNLKVSHTCGADRVYFELDPRVNNIEKRRYR